MQVYVKLGFDIASSCTRLDPNRSCGSPTKTNCTYRPEVENVEYITTHPKKAADCQI